MTNQNTAPALPIGLKALEIAVSQIGVQEEPKGSNRGPQVEAYLKCVGLGGGYAWCQAFVRWCYEQAAKELGIPNPVPNTAGVLQCWNKADVGMKLIPAQFISHAQLIVPGSQLIMDFGHGEGHTGIVEKVLNGVIHTIEGNTNDDGSREGYEVCRRERRCIDVHIKGIIRY